MAWWILAMSASVLDVSWSRKLAMSRCSESVGTAVSMGWMSFLSTPGTADFSALTRNNGDRDSSMYQRNRG